MVLVGWHSPLYCFQSPGSRVCGAETCTQSVPIVDIHDPLGIRDLGREEKFRRWLAHLWNPVRGNPVGNLDEITKAIELIRQLPGRQRIVLALLYHWAFGRGGGRHHDDLALDHP